MLAMPEYTWLIVVGAFAAFFFGWGIGANDVANSFATSVTTKTLTLKQAVVIACIFEMIGSMALGHVVTGTIQGDIARYAEFAREPEIYAYGMVIAMTVAGVWQIVASYFEVNVSSSQSIIGAIIGFALCYKGSYAVVWNDKASSSSFPPYKGVMPIVLTWFISPVMAAVCSGSIHLLLRTCVLRREKGFHYAFWVLPPAVAGCTWINIYFLLTRGAAKEIQSMDKSWTRGKAAWIAAVCGGGMAVVAAICVPFIKARAERQFSASQAEAANKVVQGESNLVVHVGEQEDSAWKNPHVGRDPLPVGQAIVAKVKYFCSYFTYGMNANTEAYTVEEDPRAAAVQMHGETFDPKIELAFGYLQVFSAICVMIAHGASEAGYMAGPLSAIYLIVKDGRLLTKLSPNYWALFIGAISMCIGLAMYGYTTIRSTGHRLAKLSPSRGFAPELTQATIVMVGGQFGLPIAGSIVITGAVIGIGLVEGWGGVNWVFLLRQLLFWILTLLVCGLGSAAIFAQSVFGPSVHSGVQVTLYEQQIGGITTNMYKNFNTVLQTFKNASSAGALPTTLSLAQFTALETAIKAANTKVANYIDVKKNPNVRAEVLVSYLSKALALYQQNTVLTIGQKTIFPTAIQCNNNIAANITDNVAVVCPAPKLLPASLATAFP